MNFRIPQFAALTLTVVLSACDGGPQSTEVMAPQLHAIHQAVGDAEMGVTGGWSDGKNVEFFYNKPFFCQSPPTSASDSGCEVGAEPEVSPRPGKIPVLYVMTPLGFRPAEQTLQCPNVGSCINHPSTLDLTRVFGAGTGNLPLPAHSHIVDAVDGESSSNGGQSGWWELEVVGVTDPAVWQQVVDGKSLARVRELQARGVGITGDIPTNAFLFFGVRPKRG